MLETNKSQWSLALDLLSLSLIHLTYRMTQISISREARDIFTGDASFRGFHERNAQCRTYNDMEF